MKADSMRKGWPCPRIAALKVLPPRGSEHIVLAAEQRRPNPSRAARSSTYVQPDPAAGAHRLVGTKRAGRQDHVSFACCSASSKPDEGKVSRQDTKIAYYDQQRAQLENGGRSITKRGAGLEDRGDVPDSEDDVEPAVARGCCASNRRVCFPGADAEGR